MGKLKTIISIVGFFVLTAMGCGYGNADARNLPRVLLISSYHPSFPTFFDQIEGIKSGFGDHPVILDIEFMDSKRFPNGEIQKEFVRLLGLKLARVQSYNVVITSDDNAFLFALKHRDGLLAGAPIVFCGVNDRELALAQNSDPMVTGVLEDVSMRDTLEVMRRLHPKVTRIVALVDDTPSGQGDLRRFQDIAAGFSDVSFDNLDLSTMTFEEFGARLGKFGEDTAALLLSAYHDARGETLLFHESLEKITARLHCPLYHLWEHGMGQGITGGKVISHRMQGRIAGEMALAIVQGKNPADMPVIGRSSNVFMFDYAQLSRFNVDQDLLPDGSVVLNVPVPLFRKYVPIIRILLTVLGIFALVLVIILFNLKKRIRLEHSLKVSEERFSHLFHQAPLAYAAVDSLGQILQVNQAWLNLFEIPQPYVPSPRIKDFLAPESYSLFDDNFPCGEQGIHLRDVACRVVTASGRLLHCAVDASVTRGGDDNHVPGHFIVRDVTRTRQRERLLKMQTDIASVFLNAQDTFLFQELLAIIVGSMECPFGAIGFLDAQGPLVLTACSDSRKPDSPPVETGLVLEREECNHLTREAIEQGVSVYGNTDISMFKGMVRLSSLLVTPIVDRNRTIGVFVVGDRYEPFSAEDNELLGTIAQRFAPILRARMEAMGYESERRTFMTAMDQSDMAIMVLDENGIIGYTNPAARITGYGTGELVGMPFDTILAQEDNPLFMDSVWKMVRGGDVWRSEVVAYRKDGGDYRVECSLVPVREVGGAITHFLVLLRDITREHALELQLQKSQKMEAVGRLAGGIAHDFNNILQVIQGYGDILLERLSPGDSGHDSLQAIQTAAERAAGLVRQLLTFGRKEHAQPEDVGVNGLIQGLETMLSRVIGEHIAFTFQPSGKELLIHANPGQIEQIIVNLCINARDAMPEGGSMVLSTVSVDLDQEFCSTHAWARPGRYARVMVTDIGTGIDPAVLDKIFEPFFTTKETGKGSGLGLSIIYAIVEQHAGLIDVASRPGKGTSISVYIPLVENIPVKHESGQEDADSREMYPGTETVLLAEDEDMVRDLARAVLEGAGYHVVVAENGRKAVEKFQSHEKEIDLVLLDVVMPELSGLQVFEAIRTQDKNVPVIFSSGYSHDILDDAPEVRESTWMIAKPYLPSELLRTIREVLDGTG